MINNFNEQEKGELFDLMLKDIMIEYSCTSQVAITLLANYYNEKRSNIVKALKFVDSEYTKITSQTLYYEIKEAIRINKVGYSLNKIHDGELIKVSRENQFYRLKKIYTKIHNNLKDIIETSDDIEMIVDIITEEYGVNYGII